MNKHSIVQRVQSSLSRFSHPKYFMNSQRFEKEKLDTPFVLRTPIVRGISANHFREIRNLRKEKIFKLCKALLEERDGNLGDIAFDWVYRCRRRYKKKDFRTFERWLKKYVKSWGSCDHLCVHPLGHLILQYPELAVKTKKWAYSKNHWKRRAAAVALIPALRRKLLLEEAFQTADVLLQDEEDLVQKGYGWMLKEASNRFPKEVFRYVMKNRQKMPRTALRYAIEKLPTSLKKEAMRKDWQKED
ncbi:MAG TPA: DNA alkylation repair protein [Verrucomicrobiae bacterium]|nr:DNA alkylation repair protein [Verrucomicrobiae bacterium]